MQILNKQTLDTYTVFFAKFGKYIVDEISHFHFLEDLISRQETEYLGSDESGAEYDSDYFHERLRQAQ